MSQEMDVLNRIVKHGSITNADSVREFQCYRLSARVLDLRNDGVPIETIMETNPDTGARYARYVLNEKAINFATIPDRLLHSEAMLSLRQKNNAPEAPHFPRGG